LNFKKIYQGLLKHKYQNVEHRRTEGLNRPWLLVLLECKLGEVLVADYQSIRTD
jgi:hypothetical protein